MWPRTTASGLCTELFPERITLDDWGYAVVDPTPIPRALVQHARRAVAMCPKAALQTTATRATDHFTDARRRGSDGCGGTEIPEYARPCPANAGTVKSRLPFLSRTQEPGSWVSRDDVRIGGGLVGTITGNTLLVYAADDGTFLQTVALSHSSGHPRLLTIGSGSVVYASGVEVHLLRLQDGLDQTLSLPGQAGPVGAVLTADGLFISYDRAYESKPGHLLFMPAANLR